MELLNPTGELTNALSEVLPKLGEDTYYFLPQEEVEYPFIVIGEQTTNGVHTKERPLVTVQQVIHVFGMANELPRVQELMNLIEATVHNLQETENFKWANKKDESVLLIDDTTKDQLWHGVLTFSCKSN